MLYDSPHHLPVTCFRSTHQDYHTFLLRPCRRCKTSSRALSPSSLLHGLVAGLMEGGHDGLNLVYDVLALPCRTPQRLKRNLFSKQSNVRQAPRTGSHYEVMQKVVR